MLRDALSRVGSRASAVSVAEPSSPAPGAAGPPEAPDGRGGLRRRLRVRPRTAAAFGRRDRWWPELLGDARQHPVLAVGLVAAVVVCIWLRFATRSALWLDEALTVDISRQPLSSIPHLLGHDGAPPLYYFLLHFWMGIFGESDLATRSLAGVIGVVNMPLVWVAGYRVGSRWWSTGEAPAAEVLERRARGKLVGWAALLLFATSPYTVYYDTEARMYGLVMLLVTAGVILYTSLLRRPSRYVAAALALDTAALVYTHYWGIYLVAVTGAGTVWLAVRGPHRRACRQAAVALSVGLASLAPWVPTLVFQLHHTGTPWGRPAALTAVIFTVTQFAGGDSDPGRALAVAYFLFMLLAVAGQPTDARHVSLDLRSRPGVRALLLVALVTLTLALVAGKINGATFADRYASVVVVPVLLVVAYGFSALADTRIRTAAVAATAAFGLVAAFPNSYISRTQGGHIGAVISRSARPGDVVAFCPDQLGPSVSRTLQGRFQEVTFPRRTPPEIVNWVDYSKTVRTASAGSFVRYLLHLAGPTHSIWYVWAPNYLPYGVKCQAIADALSLARHQKVLVQQQPSDTPSEVFEGAFLDRYSPS